MQQFSSLIRQGALKPGERLPSERVLAEQLQVSRSSVREAIRSLELQGLVVSKRGSGTFINTDNLESMVALIASTLSAGTVVAQRHHLPGIDVRQILGVPGAADGLRGDHPAGEEREQQSWNHEEPDDTRGSLRRRSRLRTKEIFPLHIRQFVDRRAHDRQAWLPAFPASRQLPRTERRFGRTVWFVSSALVCATVVVFGVSSE